MEDFKCERSKLEEVRDYLKDTNAILTGTYDKASNLLVAMDNKECWNGESHLVGMAFLKLTVQYHKLLTEFGNAPVQQAYEDLDKYLEADLDFYENWESYKEMIKI